MASNVITKRPTMADVDEQDLEFASHVVGLYNLMKTIPSEGLGRIDYTQLSNFEYEAVTYFSSELDELRSRMRGR